MKPRAISPAEVWPRDWKDLLTDSHPIAIGGDLATTEKKTSNPSALAVVQKAGLDFIVRAVVRFKTSDEAAWEAILDDCLNLPRGLRVRRVCLDATNERFFASRQRSRLAGKTIVDLVIKSESIKYLNEEMNVKAYLGNLFVNTIEDGHLLLPQCDWLRDDIRQVKRDRGTFTAEPDESGNHADAENAIELGLHGLISASGPAQAEASAVGTGGHTLKEAQRPGIKNPWAHLFDRARNTLFPR